MGNSKWKRVLSVVKRDGNKNRVGIGFSSTVLFTVVAKCKVIF